MKRISALQLGLACLVALTSACSTARPVNNGHLGFLQDLDRGGHGGSRSAQRSPSYIPSDTAPGITQQRLNRLSSVKLTWPLQRIHVTSNFGKRGGSFHEGLDLRAPPGTPVYAAHSGVVIYAGHRLRGYGQMIIVKHASGMSTIYAHNSRLLVLRGARVRMGQRIAVSGSTGQSSGPHLHFEVRDGVVAVDPLRVMPMKRATPALKRVAASGGSPKDNS